MSKTDELIGAMPAGELALELEEIVFELSKISIERKSKDEVIDAFESRTGAVLEKLKRKYLNGDALKHRNQLIRELVKYGAMTQIKMRRRSV